MPKGPTITVMIGFAVLVAVIVTSKGTERRRSMERVFRWRSETTVEGTVTIKRPVNEVYEFYRNFRNLPSFLGDVMAIDPIGPATSRWTIQGPLGIQLRWTVRVTEERVNELIGYETVSSPALRTHWDIYFSPGSTAAETAVHEVMKTPLGRVGRAALALIGKFPAEEVLSNLHRLKQLMETGRVTDTRYAVKGKFNAYRNNGNR